jgi:hypothetical protein
MELGTILSGLKKFATAVTAKMTQVTSGEPTNHPGRRSCIIEPVMRLHWTKSKGSQFRLAPV